VAMEKELRERKKGQVIQHRHVSPPLPSSSQPPGICAYCVCVLMGRFSKPTGSGEEEERAGLRRDPRG